MTNDYGAGNSQATPREAVDSGMGTHQTLSASPSYSGTPLSGAGSTGTPGSPVGSTSSMSGTETSGSGDKLTDTAGRVASRVSDTIGEEVDSRAGAGFDRAGSMLDHMADAVDRAGEQLRSEEAPVADVAKAAAGQLRSAAGYLREADVKTIMTNAEAFARRQPAIFLGGALAIGLMASRFLKASPSHVGEHRSASDTPGRFSSGMSSGYRAYGGTSSTSGAGAVEASSTGSTFSSPSGREGTDDRA